MFKALNGLHVKSPCLSVFMPAMHTALGNNQSRNALCNRGDKYVSWWHCVMVGL